MSTKSQAKSMAIALAVLAAVIYVGYMVWIGIKFQAG